MTERTALLISNPNAGRGGLVREREVGRFREELERRGVHVELLSTAGPRDAERLAREGVARGLREVIVAGGDGTVNEALQGLVGSGARVGVWPAGTANVLARHLGLPFDAEGAARAVASGRTRRITLGRAVEEESGRSRFFFLMAGVGLDASVVKNVRPRLKKRVGEAAYWFSGFAHLAHWRPRIFTVEVEGREYPATYAAVGKAPWYGGGLSLTPRARLDAGEFEVCLINTRSRLRYLRLLSHAVRGGAPEGTRGVTYLRARRLRATGDALVQTDGELTGRLPMTFEVVTEGVEIVVP
ncbi:MAG TPA: diacylglycerol kinase family protein [Pyrinomonadaceae bacterium]